eukprot:GHVQ01002558.1.p1 GENE.GHVQ01002558.1~~GHVQ01002558.1.p1  ORF type:complete len:385 (+),score=33.81 GHVQ01002558.1:271-1425(+)
MDVSLLRWLLPFTAVPIRLNHQLYGTAGISTCRSLARMYFVVSLLFETFSLSPQLDYIKFEFPSNSTVQAPRYGVCATSRSPSASVMIPMHAYSPFNVDLRVKKQRWQHSTVRPRKTLLPHAAQAFLSPPLPHTISPPPLSPGNFRKTDAHGDLCRDPRDRISSSTCIFASGIAKRKSDVTASTSSAEPLLDGSMQEAITSPLGIDAVRAHMTISFDGHLYKVVSNRSVKSGRIVPVFKTELKNITTGTTYQHTFKTSQRVELVELRRTSMEFMYESDGVFFFQDAQSWEEHQLTKKQLGDSAMFLIPGMKIAVFMFKGSVVDISLPNHVEMVVEHTETDSGAPNAARKHAVLAGGLQVLVPTYINVGEKVLVSTETKAFVRRV